LIKQRVSRGRVEISAQIDDSSLLQQKLELDLELAKDYHLALKALQQGLEIPGEIRVETLANFKDIFSRKEVETDLEKEWAFLQLALEAALSSLEQMRRDEGRALRKDFLTRLTAIEEMAREIEEKAPLALQACRDRLADRVQQHCEREPQVGRVGAQVSGLAHVLDGGYQNPFPAKGLAQAEVQDG
jgi:uncharacterized protein (TIGR00255 family)